MNVLNLPEFEVIDIIQDEYDMTVIVQPSKEPVACSECGGVEYQAPNRTGKFTWDGYITKTKTIIEEGFGVDIPQLLEVLESDKF